MSVLIDTCIVVDHLRNHAPALAYVKDLTRKPYLSVVSFQELYAGAHSAHEEAQIEDFLLGSHILNGTTAIARSAGQYMRRFGSSHGLDDLDALIAATAEHHGLGLATLNLKHFPMLRGLKRAY